MPLIVGINGSGKLAPKTVDTWLQETLDAALSVDPRHVRVVHIRLSDQGYGFHSGSMTSGIPPGLQTVADGLLSADGIICCTPVQYWLPSDLMTSFWSHLNLLEYPDFSLSGKLGASMAHCHDDGGMSVASAVARIMNHFEIDVPGGYIVYRNSSIPDGKTEGNWQRAEHILLGKRMARALLAREPAES